ncbi:ATP-binding protein [candidate division KSB1 bacterium]
MSSLLCSIIRHANLGTPRDVFLKEVNSLIIGFLNCDALTIQLYDYNKIYSFELTKQRRPPQEIVERYNICENNISVDITPNAIIEHETLTALLRDPQYTVSGPNIVNNGSFFTKVEKGLYEICVEHGEESFGIKYRPETGYRSIAVIPMSVKKGFIGFFHVKVQAPDFFTDKNIEICETIAETTGYAALDRSQQLALRERIKELSCLYGISKIIEHPGLKLHQILKSVVKLLPPAWLYPKITAARITLEGVTYTANQFEENGQKLSSPVIVEDKEYGKIEIVYTKKMPELYEGPFLLEERKLLDAVAQQLSHIITRKKDEEENIRLQEQIRHADRLATVGQLSAGIAHELNEPLANILGFAQILLDENDLPNQSVEDIKKIERASLYAREVVKKLLLFSRQMPQKKDKIDINKVIKDAFFFFESRCAKEGIEVVKRFDVSLPEIMADSWQIQQIVINLAVNAIQAMPRGGTLTLSTGHDANSISIIVKDTGIGMNDEVKKQLFVPFFTTKDIHHGTGLGLPVVHGIVLSHGGTIDVESEEGIGTCFTIIFPLKKVNNGM